ncbi:Lrp/AsnC family transcriptional regulator [Alteriqipengyuania lutimaris]|uniref:Lrp/AsnC family transcriptional regulator n=2 Tax=Alteriqipengyuania lutimaris TaxID=1538146 RepID=A0A395LHA4_9SPHN|nr:Lrp/AsnC family transcriptional regulator [Alteriqipengyuania lutimaris]
MDMIDRKILALLQNDASITIGDMAESVGLSTTPLWKRIQKMEKAGVIRKKVTLINQESVGLTLTGFVSIRTSDHSEAWLGQFGEAVSTIPEIVEVYRMAGEVDYLLKIVAPDMAGYDKVYKRLIDKVKLSDVSASFSMEVVKETNVLPLDYST